jgi:long-subunit fatty acid transport protein
MIKEISAMHALTRTSAAGAMAAGLLFVSSLSALAGNPAALTDRQLDRVTAGGGTVLGSADAQASGALSLAGTNTQSLLVSGPSPYPGQPEYGGTAVLAQGNATTIANNAFVPNLPPASSSTNVTTAGVADGNLVLKWEKNFIIQGGGGVTAQYGFTIVYGAWVGL